MDAVRIFYLILSWIICGILDITIPNRANDLLHANMYVIIVFVFGLLVYGERFGYVVNQHRGQGQKPEERRP